MIFLHCFRRRRGANPSTPGLCLWRCTPGLGLPASRFGHCMLPTFVCAIADICNALLPIYAQERHRAGMRQCKTIPAPDLKACPHASIIRQQGAINSVFFRPYASLRTPTSGLGYQVKRHPDCTLRITEYVEVDRAQGETSLRARCFGKLPASNSKSITQEHSPSNGGIPAWQDGY